jgi:hypothetical protein
MSYLRLSVISEEEEEEEQQQQQQNRIRLYSAVKFHRNPQLRGTLRH